MRSVAAALGLAFVVVFAACGSDSPAGAGTGRMDGGDAREVGDAPADIAAVDRRDVAAPEDLAPTSDVMEAPVVPGDGADGVESGDAAKDIGGADTSEAGSDVRADGAGDVSTDVMADVAADAVVEKVSMPCMATGACDPFVATSCGAQVCAVGLDGNTACVAASGAPKGLGAVCATRNECAGGLDCVSIGAEPTPTCQRMCPKGSIGFCGGEYRCTDFIVGCVQYCRLRDLPCDIYAQNCAAAGQACSLSVDGETGARYTGCRPAGTGARGDRCDQGGTCGKGLLCVREAGVSTCRQICTGDGGALPCLAAGETCSGLTSTYQVTYCH